MAGDRLEKNKCKIQPRFNVVSNDRRKQLGGAGAGAGELSNLEKREGRPAGSRPSPGLTIARSALFVQQRRTSETYLANVAISC